MHLLVRVNARMSLVRLVVRVNTHELFGAFPSPSKRTCIIYAPEPFYNVSVMLRVAD